MTTFVLKKYNPSPEADQTSKSDESDKTDETNEKSNPGTMMKIKATATVSEIIALALYKSLPNGVTVEEVSDDEGNKVDSPEINVMSTEDVNLDPTSALKSATGNKDLVVLGNGFCTEKDEWFLSNIRSQGINPIYTVSGLMSRIKTAVGI